MNCRMFHMKKYPRDCKVRDSIDQYCYCKERFLSVKLTNLDDCKDAIRSARKEDNSILFSFIHRKLFHDFGVMLQPKTFRQIPVRCSFLVCDSNYSQDSR